MKKVMFIWRHNSNEKMFEEDFEIVNEIDKADFFICGPTIPADLLDKLGKIVLSQIEPPLTQHRIWTYDNFDKFHTVLCYNPNGDNQFAFADNTLFYPRPAGEKMDIIREDTTIGNRGIYYAGMNMKGSYKRFPDSHGAIVIKETRDWIANKLLNEYPNSMIVGEGWPSKTKIIGQKEDAEFKKNWRLQKIDDLNENKIDFHLCMENCMLKHYVTEKIHDGFCSDRVTLYLGDPDIENKVPKECFINLNPLFNKETKEFDFDKMIEIIKTMTQEEYDKIIHAARKWRKTIKYSDYDGRRNASTKLIIDRLK